MAGEIVWGACAIIGMFTLASVCSIAVTCLVAKIKDYLKYRRHARIRGVGRTGDIKVLENGTSKAVFENRRFSGRVTLTANFPPTHRVIKMSKRNMNVFYNVLKTCYLRGGNLEAVISVLTWRGLN